VSGACSAEQAASGAAAAFEFELDSSPLLSRSTVDRREQLRESPESQWPGGRVVLVDRRGRSPLVDRQQLRSWSTEDIAAELPDGAVLLGVHEGVAHWAVRSELDGAERGWQDLRTAGGNLADTDAGLLTTAVSLLNWHDRAHYCSVCGASTRQVRAGWVRECAGCGREEYPRTDPAVICLVHDGADHVLLARQPVWPPERYSVLAGFVEAGESLEACVRREIAEEVGVEVTGVRYLGSQPWPFPRSLMLGFAALADRNQPLQPADGEIEDARWVHRDHVLAALQDPNDATEGLRLPPGVSIAYRMLRGWAQHH
jgi:NAD+ diphosphatase